MTELPSGTTADGPWCEACGGPVRLADEGRYVYCSTPGCPGEEEGPEAGEVAVEAQQAPAGWPRPVCDGLPVAWIAPVIAGRVDWAGLTSSRLRASTERNLCQVCGRTLGEVVWYALVQGEIAAGGPLHEACMKLAAAVCPVLRGSDVALVEAPGQVQSQGEAALLERLMALEEVHGELPGVVSLLRT